MMMTVLSQENEALYNKMVQEHSMLGYQSQALQATHVDALELTATLATQLT